MDQYLLQASPRARHRINGILASLGQELLTLVGPSSTLTYEVAYFWSGLTVLRSCLFGSACQLQAGERKAVPQLRGCYSLYSRPLKPLGKSRNPSLSVFATEGPEQRLILYAQGAASYEAANPPGRSQLTAAVGIAANAERPRKRSRPARRPLHPETSCSALTVKAVTLLSKECKSK